MWDEGRRTVISFSVTCLESTRKVDRGIDCVLAYVLEAVCLPEGGFL